MDFGSSGSDVVELQTYLAADTDIYPSGLVTGYFDSYTESAIQKFQTAQGIVSSGTPKTTGYGRVGPKTLVRINTLIYLIPITPIQSSLEPLVDNSAILTNSEQAGSRLPVAIAGRPERLIIPGINVDAAVKEVGLTSVGAMDMIKSLNDVAWYELGQRPGDNGTAVFGGHYDGRKNGEVAVFDNLYKLRQGDKIFVEDDQGVTTTFVVRESRRYESHADATDVFVSNDGKAHLNLIACDGVWNKVAKSYSQRLVVFTDRE